MVPQNLMFSFDMYPHFFDGAKKRRYPSKKRFPTPAVCSRKRCPLHKGTKALHQKNSGSDSRPPSFRPTAVFILHLSPGCFRLFFNWMGLTPFRPRCGHLPSRGGHCFGDWQRNTSSGTSCHLLLSRRRQTPPSASQPPPFA